MGLVPYSNVRWSGVAVTGSILTLLVALLYKTYEIWQQPPPFLIQDRPIVVFNIAVATTSIIFTIVGLYLARNAYLWSLKSSKQQAT